MKITKRQLKRIIKEEKRKFTEARLPAWERPGYVPERGLEVPTLPADAESLWGDVEEALNKLTTALSQLEDIDPQHANDAARYVAEEIHSWKR